MTGEKISLLSNKKIIFVDGKSDVDVFLKLINLAKKEKSDLAFYNFLTKTLGKERKQKN